VDELQRLGLQSDAGAGDAADTVSREMLESNVDSTDWKLEVERILPQLRATVNTDSKVYRTTIKKADIAIHGNPISELRDVTYHIGSHSVTCHPTQVNALRLTPACMAGTRFTYPGGMEG